MKKLVFYEVAPYERHSLQGASFPDATAELYEDALDLHTASRAAAAEVISIFVYSPMTRAILAQLPQLQLIVTRSTGYDHIDLVACRERGVKVAYVPSYGESTVAEHAFALLFSLARHLPTAVQRSRTLDFTLADMVGLDLAGKTLGIIGVGRIGLHAVRIGRGIGMRLLAHDPHERPEMAQAHGFAYVTLDALLEGSDVVMIHAALTPETFHLINRATLRRMKNSAILINTARGGIIDTEALLEALDAHWLAAVGLDVFEGEETVKAGITLLRQAPTAQQLRHLILYHSLVRRENVLLTPHMAFLTQEAIERRTGSAMDSIRAYLAGEPISMLAP